MSNRHKHIETLISMIDKAEGIWDLPWRKADHRPANFHTGKPYKGVNTLNLMLAQHVLGYKHSQWMTFNQALLTEGEGKDREVLRCVRKGSKGVKIIFFKPIPPEERKSPEKTAVIRFTTVFNIDQIEGVVMPEAPSRASTIEAHSNARDFISRMPIEVRHGGDEAYYVPSQDYIQLPYEETFFDTNDATASHHYISTHLHELAHSTGHETRLDRLRNRSELEAIATEELVAEIASVLLGIDLGLANKPRDNHAQYLSIWKDRIKDNPNVLVKAASDAEKAIAWLYDNQIEMLEAAE